MSIQVWTPARKHETILLVLADVSLRSFGTALPGASIAYRWPSGYFLSGRLADQIVVPLYHVVFQRPHRTLDR